MTNQTATVLGNDRLQRIDLISVPLEGIMIGMEKAIENGCVTEEAKSYVRSGLELFAKQLESKIKSELMHEIHNR